jgi:hypothetical protein
MLTASLPLTPADRCDGDRPRDTSAWPAMTVTSNGITVEITTTGTPEQREAQTVALAAAALGLAQRTRVHAHVLHEEAA